MCATVSPAYPLHENVRPACRCIRRAGADRSVFSYLSETDNGAIPKAEHLCGHRLPHDHESLLTQPLQPPGNLPGSLGVC